MSNVIQKSERMYFLDWLRVIVVLLIIPHHVALTFSHIGKGYIYTKEPVESLYYFIQSDFLNLWFMKLLFFISGVSAYMALKRRSNVEYILERVKKLVIPALFVTLILGPLTAFFVAKNNNNFLGSIILFYPEFIFNIDKYLGWAHMWYCVYLFTFSLLTIYLFSYLKTNTFIVEKINNSLVRNNNLLIPMVLIVLIEVLLRPFYPGFQNLINDWANFALYITLFILGYIMGQSEAVILRIVQKIKLFAVLAFLSSVMYMYLNYSKYYFSEFITFFEYNRYLYTVVLSALRGFAAYTWIMFFIGIGKKYINRNNIYLKKLSKTSFALYIFHYFILTVLNSFFVKTEIHHYIIFICSIILTYMIFFIMYKTLLKRIAFLRFICGLKNN